MHLSPNQGALGIAIFSGLNLLDQTYYQAILLHKLSKGKTPILWPLYMLTEQLLCRPYMQLLPTTRSSHLCLPASQLTTQH